MSKEDMKKLTDEKLEKVAGGWYEYSYKNMTDDELQEQLKICLE